MILHAQHSAHETGGRWVAFRAAGVAFAGTCFLLAGSFPAAAQTDPKDNAPVASVPASIPAVQPENPGSVPWGIASSAASSATYSDWLPKMAAVGIRWVRMFGEWGNIEPKKGAFDFARNDAMVDAARANHIEINGIFFGSPGWINPSSHSFPMKNLGDWSNYATELVKHYKGRVRYWEVWNEGNAGFNDGHNDATDYARLLAAAYAGAKKADPTAPVGMSVASFDAPYIDQVILSQVKMGKPGSFDFFCIHPYETTGCLSEAGGEIPYLWMAKMLREVVKADAPDKANAPIWITEVGRLIGDKKESKEEDLVSEPEAARTVVKTYIMAIAQGIQRIFWFEAQDPHGEPPGYGILNIDGAPRPSYIAMKAMTACLGPTPKPLGWLALGKDGESYGFVFQSGTGPVLVTWMPLGETDNTITFKGDVEVVDSLTNTSSSLKAGESLALTDTPVLITGLPADLVEQARAHAGKNFPWGGDYSTATSVNIQLGDPNVNHGIIQVERGWTTPHKFDDGSAGALVSPPGKHDNQNIKFIVHPSFANLKTHDYYIRVTARRVTPKKGPESYCKMDLVYEVADSKAKGPMRIAGRATPDITSYQGEAKGESFVLSDDTANWQSHTWHLKDAAFAKMWGYDIAFLIDKSDPFVIGKVEVSTRPFGN